MARTGLERMLSSQGGPAVGQASRYVRQIRPRAVAAANPTWGGYVDDNSGGAVYTAVSGSWRQPAILACNGNETELAGYWVGLDGYVAPGGTVEQLGTMAECYAGAISYYTWWEMWPNPVQIVGNTVAAGDNITASIVYNAATANFTLTLNDAANAANNINTTQACPVKGGCVRSSAEWITEAPSGGRGNWPLPNFGTWTLTAGSASTLAGALPISGYPASQLRLSAANPRNSRPGSIRWPPPDCSIPRVTASPSPGTTATNFTTPLTTSSGIADGETEIRLASWLPRACTGERGEPAAGSGSLSSCSAPGGCPQLAGGGEPAPSA